MSAPAREALVCRRCGGALAAGEDSDQLRCGYCGFSFLRSRGEVVAAYTPAGRLGRRRAAQVLAAALKKHRVRGFAIEQATLVHLPYWHVEAKLVGWQRYREKSTRRPAVPEVAVAEPEARDVEETISREVVASFPACDVRAYGLLGVAHRVSAGTVRPLSLQDIGPEELVCAPVKSAAWALRSTRLVYGSRLVPSHAFRTRQRLSLLRPHVRLIYYPVWRLRYRSGGRRYQAIVDGRQPLLLRMALPQEVPGRAWRWALAAAGSGFLAGFHPAVAAFAMGGWTLLSIHRAGLHGRPRELLGWFSRELGGPRIEVRELKG